MNEYANLLLSTVLGLFGTLVGAGVSWWIANRASRVQTTFLLYSEFNSESMLISRHKVQDIDSLFRADVNGTLDDKWQLLTSENRFHIWNVINFYQRLFIAIRFRKCSSELVPELFGEVFFWWYWSFFEKNLVPMNYRESSVRISELKAWLVQYSEPEKIEQWKQRYEKTQFSYQVIKEKSE